jgi:glycosyltransferase involved in cell wall biosynthesis
MISVVIPMYNSSRTILRCLESVFNQKGNHCFEVLIVNDGSNDGCRKLVLDYISISNLNIRIIDKENGGAASARNLGLKEAKGEWIAFLDSDDEWLPDKINIQMKILNDYPIIECLGGNLQNQKTKIFGIALNNLTKVYRWQLFLKVYPQTSTVIFKANILYKIGFFDESLRFYEDGDFWLRLSKECEFWFTPHDFVIYDGGKNGFGENGLSKNIYAMQASYIQILNKMYKKNEIDFVTFILAKTFSYIKYFRRKLILIFRQYE